MADLTGVAPEKMRLELHLAGIPADGQCHRRTGPCPRLHARLRCQFLDGPDSRERDFVVFRNRRTMPGSVLEDAIRPLDGDIYEDARDLAPGWDVRMLEREWRQWCAKEEIEPKRPEAHFVSFCRGWFEKRGRP